MKQSNPKVSALIKEEKKWKKEMTLLREIAIGAGLKEEIKWNLPCYSLDGKNIAITQNFKNFCALMFFKGYLLKDPKKLLKAVGKNSRIAKRLEFTSVEEIRKIKTEIKGFLKQAVRIEQSPVKAKKPPTKSPAVPIELKNKLASNKKFKAAFEKLTPGRRRHYIMHFASAKQSATRISRIEKAVPKILKGLGLND